MFCLKEFTLNLIMVNINCVFLLSNTFQCPWTSQSRIWSLSTGAMALFVEYFHLRFEHFSVQWMCSTITTLSFTSMQYPTYQVSMLFSLHNMTHGCPISVVSSSSMLLIVWFWLLFCRTCNASVFFEVWWTMLIGHLIGYKDCSISLHDWSYWVWTEMEQQYFQNDEYVYSMWVLFWLFSLQNLDVDIESILSPLY